MQCLSAESFSQWMAGFGENGPSENDFLQLAKGLCDLTVGPISDKSSFSFSALPANCEFFEESSSVVSWKGVSRKWFINTFLERPEVQKLLHFECPMWFVRNYCIQQLLPSQPDGSSLCMADVLEKWQDEHLDEHIIAEPTLFISYTGAYKLSMFIDLIRQYEPIGTEEVFFWCDLFCVDQIGWKLQTAVVKKEFMFQLQAQVARTMRTVLLVDSWDTILHVLGQIWVLWEIFCCVEAGTDFQVVLSSAEKDRTQGYSMFEDKGYTKLFDGLADIDVRKARARYKEDEHMIMNIIEEGKGVTFVNYEVTRIIRDWHIRNCDHAVQLRLEYLRGMKGTLAPDICLPLLHIAWWYFEMGLSSEAQTVFYKLLWICQAQLGDDHDITIKIRVSLAHIFIEESRKLDEAEHIMLEVYERVCRIYGDSHLQTSIAASNLAGAYSKNGKTKKALNLFEQVLEKLPTFDEDESFSLWSGTMLNMSDQYCFCGDHDKAIEYVTAGYERTRERYGERNPVTLKCLQKYADRVSTAGRYQDAESLYRQCLQLQFEMLGPSHADRLMTLHNLGENQYRAGAYSDAEDLFSTAIKEYRQQFEDDGICADSIQGLGMVRLRQGKLTEALELVEEAKRINEQNYGDEHPVIREAIVRVALVLDAMGQRDDAEKMCKEIRNGFVKEDWTDGMEIKFKDLFEGSNLYDRTA